MLAPVREKRVGTISGDSEGQPSTRLTVRPPKTSFRSVRKEPFSAHRGIHLIDLAIHHCGTASVNGLAVVLLIVPDRHGQAHPVGCRDTRTTQRQLAQHEPSFKGQQSRRAHPGHVKQRARRLGLRHHLLAPPNDLGRKGDRHRSQRHTLGLQPR